MRAFLPIYLICLIPCARGTCGTAQRGRHLTIAQRVAATGRPSAGEGSGLPMRDEVSQSAKVLAEMSICWVVARDR